MIGRKKSNRRINKTISNISTSTSTSATFISKIADVKQYYRKRK